jgi:formate dehydrogenase gamma subunit
MLAALALPGAARAGDPPVRIRPLAAHETVWPAQAPAHRFAADPDDCFMCHDDESLTMERGGREVSLYVDPSAWSGAPHSGLDCVDCHAGFDPDEMPHADPIAPVACTTCHGAEVRSARMSNHPDAANCASCHDDVHTAPGTLADNSTCEACHAAEQAVVASGSHGHNGAAPVCLDCHGAHRFAPADTDGCLSCHGEREFVDEHVTGENLAAILSYSESIHGQVIECSDCHSGHDLRPASDPESRVHRSNIASTCATCHDQEAEHYRDSEHGRALAAGFEGAPTCTDCHGEHDIRTITDSESPMSRQHEVQVCLSCHLDSEDVQSRMTHTAGFVAGYELSVHGRAAAAGSDRAPVCSDCHGAHSEMKASAPGSKVNKFNLVQTCGDCHVDIGDQFAASIHGAALEDGNQDAPTCTDCHSEHSITSTDDPAAPVALLNVSEAVCRPCHESYQLSAKYGFPSDRAETFGDSFHGFAGRLGQDEVANCASCHGVHDILPSRDPNSRVHRENLAATCGTCHPGADVRFAEGSVHIVRTAEGDQLLFWIGRVYLIAILSIIGLMLLHNGMDWVRKTRDVIHARMRGAGLPHAPVHPGPRKLYERMTVADRWQHTLLALSFIMLVITGFMLRYPDAWWVTLSKEVFGGHLVQVRSLTHRIAGVVMLAVSAWHVGFVVFTPRGRQFLKDMWWKRTDLTEFMQSLRYMAGLSDERPRYDRFNYVEKAEYWALVWGTVVMGATGLILWFEGGFAKMTFDVSETVHLYEAWLAFLAIVVWHFYYVIFNPDVYPLNATFLTGKVTEEDMEHEHPRELERLKAGEEGEA